MNINKLASAISRGKWLIEPNTAIIEKRRAVRFLNRDFAANIEDIEDLKLEKPKAFKAGSYFDLSDDDSDMFSVAETGSVAIIPICGTIMKYDYCGTPGTDTLSEWVKAASASPQIDAIVLLVNSGGGSVEGTGEFADVVKQCEKTILTFCDGMIASAAYWIGSSATEIWVSHQTCEIGSIGVAASFFDDSKYLEENGFQDVYINADTSPDKNMDVLEAIKGDNTKLKVNSLNPLDQIFMGAVKANRGDKLQLTDITINDVTYQEPLTGKVYLANQAIKNGLIDGICNIETAVERALELSNNKNNNNMATKTDDKKADQAVKSKTLLEKIQALFSAEEIATDEDDEEMKDAKKKGDEDDEEAKKASKKSDDEDNDNPDDEKDDDDSDEDDIEVNGKTFSMKDPKQAKAAVAYAVEMANKQLAEKDKLIMEAAEVIKENKVALEKSAEEVKREIKSTFTIKGSQRANKISVTDESEAGVIDSVLPTKGSFAEAHYKKVLANQKAELQKAANSLIVKKS